MRNAAFSFYQGLSLMNYEPSKIYVSNVNITIFQYLA